MRSIVPYNPPEHLIFISGLTASQLTEQFQAFRGSLHFTPSAPEIVFERVVANLYTATRSTTQDQIAENSTSTGEELQHTLKWIQENLTALALNPQRWPSNVVNPVEEFPISHRPTPIKFAFFPGDFGVGTRVGPCDSEDGNYGTGCTWSDFHYPDDQVQSGILNTKDWIQRWSTSADWSYSVVFPNRLFEKPTVVVWLTGADIRCACPYSVEVEAALVNEGGFHLRMKLSEVNIGYYVGVSWVAFPSSSTRYSSSTVNKVVYGNARRVGEHISGLDEPRRTLLAINKYGRSSGGAISIALEQSSPPTPKKVRWDVEFAKDSEVMCELGIVCICCT